MAVLRRLHEWLHLGFNLGLHWLGAFFLAFWCSENMMQVHQIMHSYKLFLKGKNNTNRMFYPLLIYPPSSGTLDVDQAPEPSDSSLEKGNYAFVPL